MTAARDEAARARPLMEVVTAITAVARTSARRLGRAGRALLAPDEPGAAQAMPVTGGGPSSGDRDSATAPSAAPASATAAPLAANGPAPAVSPPTQADLVEQYVAGGRVAWSPGYKPYRNGLLLDAIRDDVLLAAFRDRRPLPERYAFGLDERLVEYPWVLSRLPAGPGRVLDAGSTLNYPYLLDLPALANKQVIIVTLAPEHQERRENVSYLYDDLRNVVLRDAAFETVVCISTLEHIGLDNTQIYTSDSRYAEADREGYRPALRELERVLAPGGRLLLTVPFGRAEHHSWLQQFDAEGIREIVRTFGHEPAEATYFRYSTDGWQLSDAAACADEVYFDVHAGGPPPADCAAAARAVACLQFVKP